MLSQQVPIDILKDFSCGGELVCHIVMSGKLMWDDVGTSGSVVWEWG